MTFMESLRQSNRLELSKEPLDEFPVELGGLSRVNIFSGDFYYYSAVLWSLFKAVEDEFPVRYRGLMVLGKQTVVMPCVYSGCPEDDEEAADEAFRRTERIISDVVENDLPIVQRIEINGFPPLFRGPAAYSHVLDVIRDIFLARGGLVIDDFIELGLHYSRFKPFWEVLYEAACENDVVLALGTQSLEVIGSWYEFFLERGVQDLTYFRIEPFEGGKGLRVARYDFEVLGAALEIGLEVR